MRGVDEDDGIHGQVNGGGPSSSQCSAKPRCAAVGTVGGEQADCIPGRHAGGCASRQVAGWGLDGPHRRLVGRLQRIWRRLPYGSSRQRNGWPREKIEWHQRVRRHGSQGSGKERPRQNGRRHEARRCRLLGDDPGRKQQPRQCRQQHCSSLTRAHPILLAGRSIGLAAALPVLRPRWCPRAWTLTYGAAPWRPPVSGRWIPFRAGVMPAVAARYFLATGEESSRQRRGFGRFARQKGEFRKRC
jgi:hypothetical protein